MDQRLDDLDDKNRARQFSKLVLPHLDAAYNLARWLTRNEQDAQDVVQMACDRALRFFDGFRGDSARAWLLTIVRRTYYSVLRDERHARGDVEFDEDMHGQDQEDSPWRYSNGPDTILSNKEVASSVNRALEQLPLIFREMIVLREMDDLSYKEIAGIVGVPRGTVMSRLARARRMLFEALQPDLQGD